MSETGTHSTWRLTHTFTVRFTLPGDALELWQRLIDLDRHTVAIPLTTVTPVGARMHDGLEFVGRTSLGRLHFDDRMLVRSAHAPAPGQPGRLRVSKFGPVAGEVDATLSQNGDRVLIVWRQSLTPAWLPRWLRPFGAVVASFGYRRGLRALLQ